MAFNDFHQLLMGFRRIQEISVISFLEFVIRSFARLLIFDQDSPSSKVINRHNVVSITAVKDLQRDVKARWIPHAKPGWSVARWPLFF